MSEHDQGTGPRPKITKMSESDRSGMINFIGTAYAEQAGDHTERGLRDFANGVMAFVKFQSGIGWRRSTREAVKSGLRSIAMVNGWALEADVVAPPSTPTPPAVPENGDNGLPT